MKGLKNYKTIKVDLQDNGGGDDFRGYELAEILAGHSFDGAYKPAINLTTVEASENHLMATGH